LALALHSQSSNTMNYPEIKCVIRLNRKRKKKRV
jgi:hypothetical protein